MPAHSTGGSGLPVTIVSACLRDGRGGSPTAVLDETPLDEDERRGVSALLGTSHAVFVSVEDSRSGGVEASLRFFTANGELPGCGHGTVAALAYLAERSQVTELGATLRTSSRVFAGRVVAREVAYQAHFEAGHVDLREPGETEIGAVLDALGVEAPRSASGSCVATLGRPRLLVDVPTRSTLAALAPNPARLRDACDRLGLLGCYVYTGPFDDGRAAARMFGPSIGVPEDIANVNSTACLAAYLARAGSSEITVDMGDSRGAPSAITATVRSGDAGPVVHVGGAATITRTVRL